MPNHFKVMRDWGPNNFINTFHSTMTTRRLLHTTNTMPKVKSVFFKMPFYWSIFFTVRRADWHVQDGPQGAGDAQELWLLHERAEEGHRGDGKRERHRWEEDRKDAAQGRRPEPRADVERRQEAEAGEGETEGNSGRAFEEVTKKNPLFKILICTYHHIIMIEL